MTHEHDWTEVTPIVQSIPFDDETDHVYRASIHKEELVDDDCYSCGEDDPVNECAESNRECGHHCNHIWTHDSCDWCGFEAEEL